MTEPTDDDLDASVMDSMIDDRDLIEIDGEVDPTGDVSQPQFENAWDSSPEGFEMGTAISQWAESEGAAFPDDTCIFCLTQVDQLGKYAMVTHRGTPCGRRHHIDACVPATPKIVECLCGQRLEDAPATEYMTVESAGAEIDDHLGSPLDFRRTPSFDQQHAETQSGEGQPGEGQSGEGQSDAWRDAVWQAFDQQHAETQAGEGQAGEGQSGDRQAPVRRDAVWQAFDQQNSETQSVNRPSRGRRVGSSSRNSSPPEYWCVFCWKRGDDLRQSGLVTHDGRHCGQRYHLGCITTVAKNADCLCTGGWTDFVVLSWTI